MTTSMISGLTFGDIRELDIVTFETLIRILNKAKMLEGFKDDEPTGDKEPWLMT